MRRKSGPAAASEKSPAGTGAESLRAWLTLLHAPGIGPMHGRRLLDAYGDPAAALAAGPGGWRAAGIPAALHAGLREPDAGFIDASLRWLDGPDRGLITLHDARYPAALREITHPPLALFHLGDFGHTAAPQVAIVGARAASAQGLENARAFGAELARRGVAVTSGLAQGIDGAAHRGALEGGGATIAVCATGLDRVYPARHRELAHRIAAQGVLLSEFTPGTPPLPEHFPRRNRIISGLSLGVLVVEAAPRSGSLITARLALEQGREVFAIPGSIHSPMSRGPHALIRQGAKLVETAADILEELPALGHDGYVNAPTPSSSALEREPMQQRVLDALGFDAAPFDTLVERTSLPLEKLGAALLSLELDGAVASLPGGLYQRVR